MATGCFYGLFISAIVFLVKSDDSCDIDIENTLKTLLTPEDYPSIQVQALRKDMIRKLQEALDRIDQEDELNYKRSMSSLAQWDNLPGKRSLEALARAGYIKTLPDNEDDANLKRSLANLARNGDLPVSQPSEGKRGIESLARNGELHHKREMQQLLSDLYDKKNIGSLARNYNFPSSGKRFVGSLARSGDLARFYNNDKRNIAALAREGSFKPKRNVAALLRQDSYLNNHNFPGDMRPESPESDAEKRNIASIKAQYKPKFKRSVSDSGDIPRNKRQADYYYEGDNEEFSSPVFQNQNVYDYEELMKALTGSYPNVDKRFLGSVARSGWFRSPSSSSRYRSPDKRHIGALARLGWLPSFRSTRRFNRSGRSAEEYSCRETSSDGQAEDNSLAEEPSLEEKRFLLQPAVDQILLRKVFMHPRSH